MATKNYYSKVTVAEVRDALKAAGYRAWSSKVDDYGFAVERATPHVVWVTVRGLSTRIEAEPILMVYEEALKAVGLSTTLRMTMGTMGILSVHGREPQPEPKAEPAPEEDELAPIPVAFPTEAALALAYTRFDPEEVVSTTAAGTHPGGVTYNVYAADYKAGRFLGWLYLYRYAGGEEWEPRPNGMVMGDGEKYPTKRRALMEFAWCKTKLNEAALELDRAWAAGASTAIPKHRIPLEGVDYSKVVDCPECGEPQAVFTVTTPDGSTETQCAACGWSPNPALTEAFRKAEEEPTIHPDLRPLLSIGPGDCANCNTGAGGRRDHGERLNFSWMGGTTYYRTPKGFALCAECAPKWTPDWTVPSYRVRQVGDWVEGEGLWMRNGRAVFDPSTRLGSLTVELHNKASSLRVQYSHLKGGMDKDGLAEIAASISELTDTLTNLDVLVEAMLERKG